MTRPIETYQTALGILIAAAFGSRDTFARIPADPERDADLLMQEAVDELEQTRKERDACAASARGQTEAKEAWIAALTKERDELTDLLFNANPTLEKARLYAEGIEAERDALKVQVERLEKQSEGRKADLFRVTDERNAAVAAVEQEFQWRKEVIAERDAALAKVATIEAGSHAISAQLTKAEAQCAAFRGGLEHETGCQICADDGCAGCPSCNAPALLSNPDPGAGWVSPERMALLVSEKTDSHLDAELIEYRRQLLESHRRVMHGDGR